MPSLSPPNIKTFLNTTFLLLLCFFFTSHIRSPSPPFSISQPLSLPQSPSPSPTCAAFQKLGPESSARCAFLKAHPPCIAQGYLNYLHIFYCLCGASRVLGHSLLLLALLALFYLLGNTASHYFCSSVERLSRELRLSPTIAGVTLLSLGNGSPDVFASVVSFRSGSGEVGLSSVLGGAFFVSCVVVGIINVAAGRGGVRRIERGSFVRDVFFFLVVLCSLVTMLAVGRVDVWAAGGFTSLYFVYVSVVCATHLCGEKGGGGISENVQGLLEGREENVVEDDEHVEVFGGGNGEMENSGGFKDKV